MYSGRSAWFSFEEHLLPGQNAEWRALQTALSLTTAWGGAGAALHTCSVPTSSAQVADPPRPTLAAVLA